MVAPVAATTMTTGGKVGRHNPVTDPEPGHATSNGHDLAHELVTDDGSGLDACKVARDDVEIRATDAG